MKLRVITTPHPEVKITFSLHELFAESIIFHIKIIRCPPVQARVSDAEIREFRTENYRNRGSTVKIF